MVSATVSTTPSGVFSVVSLERLSCSFIKNN
jgi:hypothetical protein